SDSFTLSFPIKLILIASCFLSAVFSDFHRGVYISACSDSEGEEMVGVDEEVLYYADFEKKAWVSASPKFADPFDCPYVTQLLQDSRKAMKDPPLQLDPPAAPLLYPRDHLRPSKPNTLVCQASGFYPAPVNFTWTRDRLTISSSSVSQAFPQSDGTYTQFSTIELLQPEEGQVYSCSLEHPALKQPATRLWIITISITNTN
uniref:Ig-like domain-containing protein n=1 Tax=Neogobius melanostomus TaxID=47308 RepID=A0A8C6WTC3_9GOBI